MKITVLAENTSLSPDLTAEHGLSLFIETERHNILFDTGQSGCFADNAEKLGADLTRADIAVLSHGHYDHGGGIKRFFEINGTAPLYVNENVFLPYYNGSEKYIGLDTSLAGSGRIIYCRDRTEIDEELTLFSRSAINITEPINPFGLNEKNENGFEPDTFRHEQYLLIKEGKRSFLISGCSHAGVINIENTFEPDFLIGGFHLSKLDAEKPAERKLLGDIAQKLRAKKTKYYTGHCTGKAQFDFLKTVLGERAEYLSTGAIINL